MSKFPVEVSDNEGLIDAVNYLLSGPAGLGQFFKGFSAFAPGYLTGNYRIPYTVLTTYKYASGASGEFTITVSPDNSGITVGMLVSGKNIGIGAVVSSINGNIITLSVANSGDISDYQIFFDAALQPKLYVAPIACSKAEQIDQRTFKYTFAAAQPSPPFANGNNIIGTGWANSFYNGGTGAIGVAECTTTYAIFRTNNSYANIGDDLAGGSVYWDATINSSGDPVPISTDCNARVIVTGGTDRVFIAAQLNNIISYTTSVASDLSYIVQINRYYAEPNNDPTNPDFTFTFDKTISQKINNLTGITGSGSLPEVETIFTTVIDNPGAKYWWYILEVKYETTAGDLQVTENKFDLRSLSAQVVKE
jgi:hypothetical protein